MADDKKKKLDSFSRYLKMKTDRTRHMTWCAGDVEIHDPAARSSHFGWGPGDVEFHRKQIKDRLGEDTTRDVDISHLGGLRPRDHTPPETQLHPEDMAAHLAHHNSFDDDHQGIVSEYKSWSSGANDNLRNERFHSNGRIVIPNMFSWKPERYQRMDHATSVPLQHPITTYRGFSHGFPIHHLAPGAEFTDHGYTGTSHALDMPIASSDPHFNAHDPHLDDKFKPGGMSHSLYMNKFVSDDHPLAGYRTIGVIHSPAGTKGLLLDHPGLPPIRRSAFHNEKELTLQRGTRFRVRNHELVHLGDGGSYQAPGSSLEHPVKKLHLVHLDVLGQHPKEVVGE